MEQLEICENCLYWGEDAGFGNKLCDKFDIDDPQFPRYNDDCAGIYVLVADDTNLHASLRTTPTFGCNEFTSGT